MIYAPTIGSKSFLRTRICALMALFASPFTVTESIRLMLPSCISYRRNNLTGRFELWIRKNAGSEIIQYMEDNYPGFWHGIEGVDKDSLAYEIIVQDQYQVKRFIKPGSVVIDAGANIGIFALFAVELGATVHAFEPVKSTFKTLCQNTQAATKILVQRAGLGVMNDTKTILTSSKNPGMSTLEETTLAKKNVKYFDGYEEVHVVSLDSLSLPKVDFIKIDTEGHEDEILVGAKETILRFKPVIAMSAYHGKDDKKELPKLLKEIFPGYVCELNDTAEEVLICYVPK